MGLFMSVGMGLGQTNDEILQQADATRFIQADSFASQLHIVMERVDEATQSVNKSEAFVLLEAKHYGSELRQRISFTKPDALKGTVYLVIGDEILFWQPTLKTPGKDVPCKDEALKISGQQKLFGDASIGEAAGIRFAGKYTVSRRTEEKLNERELIRLSLVAQSTKTAYQNVILWSDKKTFEPQRVDLFGLDPETPIKRVTYPKYDTLRGDRYASQAIVEDLLFKGQKTTITGIEIRIEPLPDARFDPATFCK
jgi:hypothetical protein